MRQVGTTCQARSGPRTKPYALAAAGLPKMSGWWTGLTPSRLHGFTNPPLARSPPIIDDQAAEVVPSTPRAVVIANTTKVDFPIMVFSSQVANADCLIHGDENAHLSLSQSSTTRIQFCKERARREAAKY